MSETTFSEQEMPYEILQQFGLTEEMITDLPEHALKGIFAGRRSPVLPVKVTNEQGEVITCRTRFCLMRNEEDKVDVIFIPQLIETDLTQFPEDKQKLLEAGHAIIEPMTTSEGREVMAFHQIDFETGQVLSVPTPVIGRNLQLICDHFHLSNAELSCLSNGKPLTVSIDDEPVTMGIDLDDLTGIRVSKGDEQQWRAQPKKEWEKYNFGIYGCWTMDENGNLDYTPEEEYADEMWNELNKKSESRKQQATHKM